MEKTKICVLDMQPIDPPVGGGRIRLLGLYSGMDEDIDVRYVGSYDWRGPQYREVRLSQNLLEIDVPLSEAHFAAHDRFAAELGKSCIDCAFLFQGQLSPALINRAMEEAAKADAVVFSHPWLFPLVAPELDASRQLIVYDSQNCEALLREKLLDNGSPAAEKVCRAVAEAEYELCHAADLILACSEEDRQSFITLYGVEPEKIRIVPNGVFTTQLLPPSQEEKCALKEKLALEKNAVCFIGSDYDPNYEAAQLVLSAASGMPETDFLILGGVGERLKREQTAAPPNVRITGFLEESEKRDYLRACDLAVNPMLSGSGTNIKMFDFMAVGLPIVSTDIGARGIENTNGRVYQLCEKSTEGLRSAIEKLLAEPKKRALLSEGGRHEAEVRYSWESISRKLGGSITAALTQKRTWTEKVLMVSTYPPEKCGIGRYAQQQTVYLRKHGSQVDVYALRGSGKYRGAFDSEESILRLKELARLYDRVIIQYHASFFYEGADVDETINRHEAFEELFLDCPNIEVICHEVSFPEADGDNVLTALDVQELLHAKKRKWAAAQHLIFHTEKELNSFCEKLGFDRADPRFELVSPSRYYMPERDISQRDARAELGIPADACVFLCIGFIQAHKAFDQVAKAFSTLNEESKRLYIVGSLRYVSEETSAYLEALKSYSGKHNITVVDEFVSDEAFDTWILASDCVVIPYKEIWSSGVLGRAKMLHKRSIAHNAGGLSEQLQDGDILFEEYEELPEILKKFTR